MQHKKALLEALENLGWPISYEDVILLEDEILAALTYMQQASDLQEAVKKETEKSSESHISKSKKVQIGRAFFFFQIFLFSMCFCSSLVLWYHLIHSAISVTLYMWVEGISVVYSLVWPGSVEQEKQVSR